MKKFRWILLSGLLVATTQIAQAQPPGAPVGPPAGQNFPGAPDGLGGAPGGAADAGAITNTTTTTTTSGVAPDGSNGGFVSSDGAAMDATSADSSMPNTGGEPMIAVLAGLSIAGAAVMMRRKVSA